MDEQTINQIFESLKVTLEVTEADDIAILREVLNDAIAEIKKIRNYPSDMSEAKIEADMQKYISNIKKLTKYDYSLLGAEGEESHSENGTNRAFYDRAKCLDGVIPICRQF